MCRRGFAGEVPKGGSQGMALGYADLRKCLGKAGIHVSERDYEVRGRACVTHAVCTCITVLFTYMECLD